MMRTPKAILSAGEDDALPAYLFFSKADPSVQAVSRHPTGENLPTGDAPQGWICDGAFALGVREAMPVRIAPEPVLRGLANVGYFIWRDGSNPKGTSQ
jgi:hypothetical protein